MQFIVAFKFKKMNESSLGNFPRENDDLPNFIEVQHSRKTQHAKIQNFQDNKN